MYYYLILLALLRKNKSPIYLAPQAKQGMAMCMELKNRIFRTYLTWKVWKEWEGSVALMNFLSS